jgi:hypothetical protein
MNYSESLTEFNNFDKKYDKTNNTYINYLLEAENYLYFRNLRTIFTIDELEILLYKPASFSWVASVIGKLHIGDGCIFNLLFNVMNQYFNPEVIFNKNGLDALLSNSKEPNEILVNSMIDCMTYTYDFVITLI